MIQIDIPGNFLEPLKDPPTDTSRDTMMKKISNELLPKGKSAALMREPDNRPTRLLCAILWLKLNFLFIKKGTQREAEELFRVKAKQLSKLLMGHKYYVVTDQKGTNRKTSAEESKCPKRKSLRSSTVVKPPKGNDNDNEGE